MTVTLQEITAWQDTPLRWKQWVDGSDQLIKGFLEAEDAVEAGRVVERCRVTQFEAEVWNSLNQADPSERKALCRAAFLTFEQGNMEGQSRSEQECGSFVARGPGEDEGSEGRKVKYEGLNGRKVGTGSIWHVSGPLDCERVDAWYRYVCRHFVLHKSCRTCIMSVVI